MPTFAEIDPSALWGGASILLAGLVAAFVSVSKSRRETAQGERIDALKEWQQIHADDREQIQTLKSEMSELRRRIDANEAKFSRMLGHIVYLERLLQSAGVKVETWAEVESKPKP